MNLRKLACGWMGIVAAFGVGCSSTSAGTGHSSSSSCGLETKGLTASVSAQARGANTQILAALFASGEKVALECGDVLSATVGGTRVVLEREEDSEGGPIHYVATIPSPTTDAKITLALERAAPKTSAPTSTMYLPASFAVRDVSANVRMTAKEDIQFRLDPPIDAAVTEPQPDSVRLRLELEGSCIEPAQFVWSKAGVYFPPLVKSDGTVSIVNTHQVVKRKGDEARCDVTLRVVTFTAGALDPAFTGPLAGGSAAEASRHEETHLSLEW